MAERKPHAATAVYGLWCRRWAKLDNLTTTKESYGYDYFGRRQGAHASFGSVDADGCFYVDMR